MSEGYVVQACIQWLCLHGCDIIRNNTGAFKTDKGHWIRFGKKGSGDIIACGPQGRYIEVECKSHNGDMRPEQIDRQKKIQSLHGVYIVARSIDDLEKAKSQILAKLA